MFKKGDDVFILTSGVFGVVEESYLNNAFYVVIVEKGFYIVRKNEIRLIQPAKLEDII